jgi:hypothetical protein
MQNPEIASVSGFFIFTSKQKKAKNSKKHRFPGELFGVVYFLENNYTE